MDRSLSELLAAVWAGESLTPDEFARLATYADKFGRLVTGLKANLSPEETARGETGNECEAFLAQAFTLLDAVSRDPIAEHPLMIAVTQKLHESLSIVRLQEDLRAHQTGQTRRQTRQRRHGAHTVNADHRKAADRLLAKIEEIKAGHARVSDDRMTDAAAARVYLRKTDRKYANYKDNKTTLTKKIEALTKRVRHARDLKKSDVR